MTLQTFYEAGKDALAQSRAKRREREMSKPDDIPQDVWSFCTNWGSEIGLQERQWVSAARAIMAEREACATAACPPNKVFGHSGGLDALNGYISGRADAADAIRKRGAFT